MRRVPPILAAGLLLAGPGILAQVRGGYFDLERLWAGIAAWALVALAAWLPGERPGLPGVPGRLLVGGLAALTALTALSAGWAPLAGPARDDLQRLALYLGALLAGLLLLRRRGARRAVEPALLAGAAAAAAVGLSERLLPWLVSLERVLSAGDRLAQPVSYWNALGVLCALGLVLGVGIAADPARSARTRSAALGAAPLLVLALHLTFSRGALGALIAGLAVLVALAPRPLTARAVVVALGAGAVPVLAATVLPGVRQADAAAADGAGVLAALVYACAAAAAAQRAWVRRADAAPARPVLRSLALAALALALATSVAAAVAGGDDAAVRTDADARRLTSAQSNRYEYWQVAARTWAEHPLLGVGSGGFAVEWLRERPVEESVRDAHSLYLETAAELGLAGVLALLALLAGGVLAARAARAREGPAATAGAIAALAVWALHAGLDWDWEVPAVTLPALLLAARLALGGRARRAGPGAAPAPPRAAS